jgi:hypothetical protein
MFRYGGAVFRQIARHPIPIDPVNAFLQRQRGILQAFDFRDRHDWSPSRVRITRLRRNDEPEGAKSTGPNLAETMPEVHAIGSRLPATGRLETAKATASPLFRETTSGRVCIRGRCSVITNSPPVKSSSGCDRRAVT